MKAIYTSFFLFFAYFAIGQSTFNVKGIVEDTLGNPLISSTVLLLDRADSTLVKFTRTELDGSFAIRKIPVGSYLLKTTYVAYIPRMVDATSAGDNVDLGTIKMTELAPELMEVVIKAAKAPIKMRGDTIEYDASTFQVPEGSSVEELLRQLPGIEIDETGAIEADGLSVDRVTVDGKKFFGNDPKAATKNLPAEGISKIQVFDTKTESDKVTGQQGEAESKTMNLELKQDFKKGGFGRIVAGGGTDNRGELKGNYNKFNDKVQFSLVGVGNNTGRNGLGWNDYQDFMGSQSFSFSDDGAYGFGGNNGMMFINFGGNSGSSIENSVQSIFFNNNDNGGFPVNYNGGVNFNYDHKKTEFSSVYYYNQAGLQKNTNQTRRSFFQDYTLNNVSVQEDENLSQGHRAEISLDQEIDSLHSFRIDINGAYINENNDNTNALSLSRDEELTSQTNFLNTLQTQGYLFNSTAFFRKKFKKKGRRFGANVSFLTTALDKDGSQLSSSTFYAGGMIDSLSTIDQLTLNLADKTQIKSNAVYVEPISKKFFSQSFYNFSTRTENGDRTVDDVTSDTRVLNIGLTRKFENRIDQHRAGTAIRYSNKGTNISIGGAYQVFNLLGDYQGAAGSGISGNIDKTFMVWVPHFSFGMSPSRNLRYSVNYGVNATEPSIENLQAIVDNSNPLYIFEGNPNLTPNIDHVISGRFSKNFPLSQVRIFANGSYTINANNTINNETVDENLITRVQPINYEGGNRISAYGNVNFPIVKKKLKGSVRFRTNIGNSFAFVNSFLNKTQSFGYYPSVNLTFTPAKETAIYLKGSWNIVDTKYDINRTQDQRNIRTVYSVTANSLLFWKVYGNASFDYTQVQNDRFGFNESVPILNASIYRQFLPGNKAEIRLSIYDALNQNRAINQFASGNSLTESEVFSLGRYVMLSMTYNIKGLKSGVNKGGMWH